jgi:hypothetical protein
MVLIPHKPDACYEPKVTARFSFSKPQIAQAYRRILRYPGPLFGWLVIWAAGILIIIYPSFSSATAIGAAFSAVLLAQNSISKALVKTAMGFFLFWTSFSIFSTLAGLSAWRAPAPLAAWLGLGLHLALVWTPLELGRAWRVLTFPFLGKRLAALTSLGLIALLKVIPLLRLDLLAISCTLTQRVPNLPLKMRLTLLGRTLVRLSLSRSYELTRALISR